MSTPLLPLTDSGGQSRQEENGPTLSSLLPVVPEPALLTLRPSETPRTAHGHLTHRIGIPHIPRLAVRAEGVSAIVKLKKHNKYSVTNSLVHLLVCAFAVKLT